MGAIILIIVIIMILAIAMAFVNGVFLLDKKSVFLDSSFINYIEEEDETYSTLFKAGSGILLGSSVAIIISMIYLWVNFDNSEIIKENDKIQNYNTNKEAHKFFMEKIIQYGLLITTLLGLVLFGSSLAIKKPTGLKKGEKFIYMNIAFSLVIIILIVLLSISLFKKNIVKTIPKDENYTKCIKLMDYLNNNYDDKNNIIFRSDRDISGPQYDYFLRIRNFLEIKEANDELECGKKIDPLAMMLLRKFPLKVGENNTDNIERVVNNFLIENRFTDKTQYNDELSEKDFKRWMLKQQSENIGIKIPYEPSNIIDRGSRVTYVPYNS